MPWSLTPKESSVLGGEGLPEVPGKELAGDTIGMVGTWLLRLYPLTSVSTRRVRDWAGSQAVACIMLVIASANSSERRSGPDLESSIFGARPGESWVLLYLGLSQ